MTYYWHSIAIKAGYNDENEMAHKIYEEHQSTRKIGVILGRYAGVYAISNYCINAFLRKRGVKLNPKGGPNHRGKRNG